MFRYLRYADVIVEMENGIIKAIGPPNEILKLEETTDDVILPTTCMFWVQSYAFSFMPYYRKSVIYL